MEDSAANPERRRHPRLSMTSDLALIMLPEENRSGAPIDISMGGLSFLYRGDPLQPEEGRQHGILIGEDDLWLENMSFQTVHDFPDREQVSERGDEHPLRRRCLQFCNLSEKQRTLLEKYIRLNT